MCVCFLGGGCWRIRRTHIELLKTERTLNYLKPFQILIKGGGGGIKQGFWHFLKFKIK